jgi:hypothetical protein
MIVALLSWPVPHSVYWMIVALLSWPVSHSNTTNRLLDDRGTSLLVCVTLTRPIVCWMIAVLLSWPVSHSNTTNSVFQTKPGFISDYDYLRFYVPLKNFSITGGRHHCRRRAAKFMPKVARCSGPLSREGSLSCHTCCGTGPRFFLSYPKDRPI